MPQRVTGFPDECVKGHEREEKEELVCLIAWLNEMILVLSNSIWLSLPSRLLYGSGLEKAKQVYC